jgi:hypothetical protein
LVVCQLLAAGWLFVSYLQQVGCLSVTCGRLVVCQLLVAGWLFVSFLQQVGCLSVTCGRLAVCQLLAAGWLFSPGYLVSSTNKADPYDITEVALNTINQIKVINLCNVIY